MELVWCTREMSAAHSAPNNAFEGRRGRPLVLVVEDTNDLRALFVSELVSAGFSVLQAADGQGAIDEAFRASPQAVVLDLMLPGINGFSVARLLRANERTRDTAIVAVTALSSDALRTKALDSGCDAFLRKPVIAAAIVGEIVRLLARRTNSTGSPSPA